MRIGVISNTDSFIPFTYALAVQQLQVNVFFSPGKDAFIYQKVIGFVQQFKLSFTEEKNADKDLYQWLKKGNYDVCFILGYPHLIQINRLKDCTTQLFNIHFGDLPAFRGPVPVFWQLKKGVDKIGLSIHRLSSKFDAGPVVWAGKTVNLPHYNYQIANQVLGQLCVEGVFYILRLLMHQLPIPVINTDDAVSAYQKRPGLQDVLINWQQMDAIEICNLIQACNPWNKGALTFFNGQEIKLMDATLINTANPTPEHKLAGTIVEDAEKLFIRCKDGKVINTNMVFYNECFIPAYQCKNWGLSAGQKLG